MHRLLLVLFFFVAIVATTASKNDPQSIRTSDESSESEAKIIARTLANLPTITKLVEKNKAFDTLEVALETTLLNRTLNGVGPFTVFAPTDAAFAKLGDKTVQDLLKDPLTLSDILLYHVVRGKVLKKDVKSGIIKSANGDNLRLRVTHTGGLIINESSKVTTFDVMAQNGVVHIIDEVLIPPKNLVDTIMNIPRFSTLAAAINAAGLTSTLRNGSKEYTIFAPNNAAFKALGQGTVDALLKDPETLKSILLYHTVPGSVLRGQLKNSGVVKTVQGSNVEYKNSGGTLTINTSKVVRANILASNGVVHEIDKVLTIPTN